MAEENFEEEMISEKIAMVEIPQLYTTRERSRSSSGRKSQPHTHRDMTLSQIDLHKLLYGGS